MELSEAIDLISGAKLSGYKPQSWADLGCGSGLFSRGLAHILPPESLIIGVDKSAQRFMSGKENQSHLKFLQADFVTDQLPFENLDGILMANSLHFTAQKEALLKRLKQLLLRDGMFLIIEYDTETPNPWVPYPISFANLERLFARIGYSQISRIGERQSRYHGNQIYAALVRP